MRGGGCWVAAQERQITAITAHDSNEDPDDNLRWAVGLMIFKKRSGMNGAKPVLLHCHLFKNGGSTIDWALRRSFGDRFVDHRDDRAMLKGGMAFLEKYVKESGGLSALASHHMPFHPEFESKRYIYWHIVMLRDPIARAASVYHFERLQSQNKDPETPLSLGATMAKQLDMRGYFEWRMRDDVPVSIRDFHVRYLADIRNPGRKLRANDFDVALAQAARNNVLVGLLERFDESMVLFEHYLRASFGEIDLAYIRQNQNSAKPDDSVVHLRQELGECLFSTLCEKNALDMRAYASLKQAFDARVGGMRGFAQHLELFRSRCAELH